MSNQPAKAIVISPAGAGFAITIPGEALRIKESALAKAKPISQVTNADEQAAAIQAASVIKGLMTETEKTRETIKKPYWDAGKAIDARAKEYVAELTAEAQRLERLVGAFQKAEADKAAAAARQAEEARQQAERAAQAESDRLAKIEADKAAAEAAAAAATTKKARAAAEAEADRLEAERQEAQLAAMEAEDDLATANATVVMPDAPAATGAAVSFVTEYEVTDIEALYAWDLERRKHDNNLRRIRLRESGINRPFVPAAPLVKLEIRKQDFKDFISGLDDATLDSIPGVTFTKTAKAAVRGVSPALTLQ